MTAHADVTETIESNETPRRDVGYEINDGILNRYSATAILSERGATRV